MKKNLIAALVGLFAIFGLSVAANAAYTTASVNLRTGPSTSHAVVHTMNKGSHVTVYFCNHHNWCRVKVNGHRGWMSGKYIGHAHHHHHHHGLHDTVILGPLAAILLHKLHH